MRTFRLLASTAAGAALVALLSTPAGAARPVPSGSFVGDWLSYNPDAATCSIAIEYAWQDANGIDRATVQFQMKTPTATEWTDVGALSSYDPRMRVPRTYSYTAGLSVAVTGVQHVFRAVGQAVNHRDLVIAGTQAISTTSPSWNCG
ncbi:MAG TPA: hypothetical protein VFH66_09120 [Mycobacteriales bacterium]|nr:hypothetical protein [Mycobacteriales bacterium]